MLHTILATLHFDVDVYPVFAAVAGGDLGEFIEEPLAEFGILDDLGEFLIEEGVAAVRARLVSVMSRAASTGPMVLMNIATPSWRISASLLGRVSWAGLPRRHCLLAMRGRSKKCQAASVILHISYKLEGESSRPFGQHKAPASTNKRLK
jgi:hypothetical protein